MASHDCPSSPCPICETARLARGGAGFWPPSTGLVRSEPPGGWPWAGDGWRCPVCGVGVAPWRPSCPACRMRKEQDA